MKLCNECKTEMVKFAWNDEWRFDEYCSEECYQKSEEWKSLQSRTNFFLENLTEDQKLDLYIITKSGYSLLKFLDKVDSIYA